MVCLPLGSFCPFLEGKPGLQSWGDLAKLHRILYQAQFYEGPASPPAPPVDPDLVAHGHIWSQRDQKKWSFTPPAPVSRTGTVAFQPRGGDFNSS